MRGPRLLCLSFPIYTVGEVDGKTHQALRSERPGQILPLTTVTSEKLPHVLCLRFPISEGGTKLCQPGELPRGPVERALCSIPALHPRQT